MVTHLHRLTASLMFTALLGTIVAASRPAHAQEIPIANYSFEADRTSTYTYPLITDWVVVSGGGNTEGTVSNLWWSGNPYGQHLDPAPDGTQMAFLQAGTDIYQDVSANLAAGTYTLTAWFGEFTTETSVSGNVELLTTSGQLLADTGVVSTATTGVWQQFTVQYVATGGNSYLGDGLRVELVGDTNQMQFDDIQLDFAPSGASRTPEPGSLALLAGAGLATFRVLKCKRNR